MSKLNDVIDNNAIPQEIRNDFSKCFFCSKEITEGGSWCGTHDIGVCVDCCDHLIDLLIDTLEDADTEYQNLNSEKRLEKLMQITKERFLKKEKDSTKLESIRSMKKLGLKYYAEVGIIDSFELAMSPDELKRKIHPENDFILGCEFNINDVDDCVEKIKKIIYDENHEEPHTIKFFSIPNFDYGNFDIGCVAKISNNGSTYIFVNDEKYIKHYESWTEINLVY